MSDINKTYLDLQGLTQYDEKIKEYIPITHGYYSNGNFYSDSELTELITPEGSRLYIDLANNGIYEYKNNQYVSFGGGGGGGAQIQSDWEQSDNTRVDFIKNKPTLGTSSALNVAVSGDASISEVVKGDDSRLSDARTPVSHNHTKSEITDFPTLGTASAKNVPSTGDASTTEVVLGNDSRLTNARTPVSHTHTTSDISNFPTLGTAAAKDVPTSGNASTTQVVMGNDSRLSDSRPASDVSSWAKASTKPTYTASEVGAIATTVKGVANGVAELDSAGKVPSSQLPSYVDDVVEVASYSNLPTTGETGKIYVTLDTDKTYRWSGSAYVQLKGDLALGETSSTAYRGDRGKTAYDHSQISSGNPHGVTKTEVGLGNVTNNAQVKGLASGTTSGHVVTWGANGYTVADSGYTIAKSVPSDAKFTDTTYSNMTAASGSAAGSAGLVPAPAKGDQGKYLRGDATWQSLSATTVGLGNVTNNKQVKGLSSGTTSGHIVTWGSDGYTVADSGYTIAKSVPADAVFTDNNNRKSFYGTCATAAATAKKVVTLSDSAGWELKAGTIVGVKFTYSNTASSCTLNVNGTGDKSIWYNNAVYTGNSNAVCGVANRINYYMYDGSTYWVWMNMGTLDGNTDIRPSAYCDTAAGTAAKVASCTGYSLLNNSYLHVIIVNANTSKTALTLNVNGKGAKTIYINGTISSASNYTLPAGSYIVYYDGTYYHFRTDGRLPGMVTNIQVSSTQPTNQIAGDIWFKIVSS